MQRSHDPFRQFTFYRVPKALFEKPYQHLRSEAKLLYGFLLDLRSISVKNANEKQWRDKDGNIYVIFPQQKIQVMLGCKHDKAIQLLQDLEKYNLIRRNKMGCYQCDQIVVLPVQDNSVNPIQDISVKTIPDTSDNSSPFIGYSASSNNDNSNTNDINNTDIQNIFDALYDMYPVHRRGNKADGYRIFCETITTYGQALLALENCSAWCKSANWSSDGGKFVPQLANFFVRGYWAKQPLKNTRSIWGSGTLGEEELEAIKKLMRV